MNETARARYDCVYERSLDEPEAFWLEAARMLDWRTAPSRAFEQRDPPSFSWFPDGRTNISYNALDRHVLGGATDRLALIALDERGARRTFTYGELLAEVERAAAGLRGLGIGHGDRVTIYMPTTAEAIIAMLACVRIGAIHGVVFAGFGAGALGDRIRASGSRLLFTADVTFRKGKNVDLLSLVADALSGEPHQVEHVVVLPRVSATDNTPGAGGSSLPGRRPAQRRSPNSPFTDTAATPSTSRPWGNGCSASVRKRRGGPRPTSAGSWATATSCMHR
jgi:acetyl-CoA synthetase